jgi:hypothetical protein
VFHFVTFISVGIFGCAFYTANRYLSDWYKSLYPSLHPFLEAANLPLVLRE